MIKSFRDLLVWQRSIQLAVAIYQASKGFPREEIYGLTSQIRRASVSVSSNIAEGHGRLTKGEFKQFLGMARASNFEVQTQLEIARAVGIGNALLLDEAEKISFEVGKMISGLMKALSSGVRG
jgi:four helix bundle protein